MQQWLEPELIHENLPLKSIPITHNNSEPVITYSDHYHFDINRSPYNTHLCVHHVRHYGDMTRQRRQTIFQQRRQWMVLIRRMPLSTQYRQQYVADAGERQSTIAVGATTQIDEMQTTASSGHCCVNCVNSNENKCIKILARKV